MAKPVKRDSLKKGDKVKWNTSQGETAGKVEGKVTRTAKVKGHVAKATKANPEYRVKTTKSGKTAIHKKRALKKV